MIILATLIHSSVHKEYLQTQKEARERRIRSEQTCKKQRKVVIRIHISRHPQSLLTIPIASWECRQAKPIKNKHFQALKLAVRHSRYLTFLELELHTFGIDSMKQSYILDP